MSAPLSYGYIARKEVIEEMAKWMQFALVAAVTLVPTVVGGGLFWGP